MDSAKEHGPAVPQPRIVYDAFLSYSHAADGQLAPALRNGLLRFATPWGPFRWANPVRSLRIFQDTASLSANPALWSTIEQALAAAEWFVLLASPDSAQSQWVEKEVDFWCRHKSLDRLLILQTDGRIEWNHTARDFDWVQTDAVPNRLRGVFPEAPRWVDARFAHTKEQASVSDPRFRDLVAELAAPMRGIPKDDLIGEDIRQHHRLNVWRNAATVVVALLFVGALVAAILALQQRKVAEERRATAERNQSAALAALSEVEAETGSPATAVRLALATLPKNLAMPDRPYARAAEGAALHALLHLQELRRFDHPGGVRSVAYSPDGHTLATGSNDRAARLWDVATGREMSTLRGHEANVSSVAFSPDGRTVATGSQDKTARLWDVATGRELVVFRGNVSDIGAVAFSPDGRTLATGCYDETVRLWEASMVASLQPSASKQFPGRPARASWHRLPSARMAAHWQQALRTTRLGCGK